MDESNFEQEQLVWFLQLYSDMWITSLRHTGVSSYAIHVNLMNFRMARGETTFEERTFVDYFPVAIDYKTGI